MIENFFLLFNNLIPLYVLIGLGFFAGKVFNFDLKTLGGLAIYIGTPAVMFGYAVKLEFQVVYLALPVFYFLFMSCFSFFWYALAQRVFPDKRANLLAITTTASNTGYLGLPLAMMLLDEHWVAVYIFTQLGGVLYEATVMFYILARGNYTVRQSLTKLLKLPAIYAISFGVLLNFASWDMPALVETYWHHFRSLYIIIGMMLIGVALSKITKFVLSKSFLSITMFAQFLVLPAIASGLALLDFHVLNILGPEICKIFFILSIVPPAAAITAYAAELDVIPEKAATTVLLGTVFAIFYIPLALMVFDQFILPQTP